MGRFTSVNASKSVGYDDENGLIVLPAVQKAQLYLIGGEYLKVYTEDPDIASVVSPDTDVKSAHRTADLAPSEKGEPIRLVTIKAGSKIGTTQLWAGRDYMNWAGPVTIRVVQNAERRQVGRGAGEATPEMRAELAKLSLRDAVLRIAEDQMHSTICLGDGFGKYMTDEIIPGVKADWCGGFVYWCWSQAAAIKGVANPFGDDGRVLWSPQRAIGWAMRNPDKVALLRYSGGDPGPNPGKGTQEFHDLGWHGYKLERGDVVLVRKVGGDGWQHVTQVDWAGETNLHTLDGNQGSGHSIRRRTYDLQQKLSNGQYRLAFLHVLI